MTHVYHVGVPSLVRRDADKPVSVFRRGSLGHGEALSVAVAVVWARHSLARSSGEAFVAHAEPGLPARE